MDQVQKTWKMYKKLNPFLRGLIYSLIVVSLKELYMKMKTVLELEIYPHHTRATYLNVAF
jgi:hypothetical protein